MSFPSLSLPRLIRPRAARGRHAGVMEADPYAYRTAHRRAVWLLRASVVVNVSLAAALVVAMQAFAALLPLKETRFALLRADPSDDRIYRVEPLSVDVDGFDLMLEKLARRYVRLILTIDGASQDARFREVLAYSDKDFFNRYLKAHESGVEKALHDGLTRSITVLGAHRVEAVGGTYLYAVEFAQTDRIGEEHRRRELLAFVRLAARPHAVGETFKFENPLGLRVLALSVQEPASRTPAFGTGRSARAEGSGP